MTHDTSNYSPARSSAARPGRKRLPGAREQREMPAWVLALVMVATGAALAVVVVLAGTALIEASLN